MNLRVTIFLSYEGDGKEINELVGDINEVINKNGFGNVLTDDKEKALNSMIIVSENKEIEEVGSHEFFKSQMKAAISKPIIPVVSIDEDDESEVVPPQGERERNP